MGGSWYLSVYHGRMMRKIILMGPEQEQRPPSLRLQVGVQQLPLAEGPPLFFSTWMSVSLMLLSAKKFTRRGVEFWGNLRFVLVVSQERIRVSETVEVVL